MAANDNTGTPQQGAGPQGNAGTTSDGTSKKIAGKYDTIEEAVEKGYVGLEQGFQKLSENVGQLTKLVETLATNSDPAQSGSYPGYVPVGQGGPQQWGAPNGGYGQRYNPYQQPDPDYIDPTQFVVNPSKHLAEREERLLGKVAGMVSGLMTNAMTVNEFKASNPDLIKHERLVQAFLREEDQRKPLAERLANAGTKTKAYLSSLSNQQGGGNAAPGSDQYVPGPNGQSVVGGAPYNMGGVNQQQQLADEEKELYEAINEQNRLMASHFGSEGDGTNKK